jgi:hypothetical protein
MQILGWIAVSSLSIIIAFYFRAYFEVKLVEGCEREINSELYKLTGPERDPILQLDAKALMYRPYEGELVVAIFENVDYREYIRK